MHNFKPIGPEFAAFFIGVVAFLCASPTLSSTNGRSTICPLAFEEAPRISETGQLTLGSGFHSYEGEVAVLRPSPIGLYVMTSDQESMESLVGTYLNHGSVRTESVRAADLVSRLYWGSVGYPIPEEGKSVSEVRAGIYRVVLVYLSPVALPDSSAHQLCMAISPTFRVVTPFLLLKYEAQSE